MRRSIRVAQGTQIGVAGHQDTGLGGCERCEDWRVARI